MKHVYATAEQLNGAARDILYRNIMDLVEMYWDSKMLKPPFRPGVDPVPVSGKIIDKKDMTNLVAAALEGWLTEGHWVEAFEKRMAPLLGQRAAAMVNSGSSANLLAISALTSQKLGDRRLKPGDKVVTAAAGFPTTINPIIQNGLIPIFVDVEIGTYVPNIGSILYAAEYGAKAVILAHTLGNPWPVDEFAESGTDAWIIEDNCDSLFSELNGKRTGSLGHLATQSFYPAHHITTGEGGMVLGSAELIKIVKSFRDWGRDCWCPTGHDNTCGKRFEWELGELPSGYDHKYIYSEIGYNLKSTDLQGALGLSQISRIQEFTDIRKRNFHQLRMLLDDLEEFFIMPMPTKGSSPSWFGFPLTIRTHAPFGLSAIEAFMANRKIGTRRLFAGNYLSQPLFVDYKNEGQHQILRGLPNTDIITSNTFWIGTWPGLEAKQIEYMAENIHDFVRQF